MSDPSETAPVFAPLGETGLLVFFPNRISPAVNAQVHTLRQALINSAPDGIVDLVPAYASLLISFDPDRLYHAALVQTVERIISAAPRGEVKGSQAGAIHVVPVRYGGDYGPDLSEVAGLANLSADEVIRLHTSRSYRAYFLGFLPGFAYLGSLPRRLAAPRLATPRTHVAAGSVAIAGGQTAVYSLASPGGWRLLGRTSLTVWNPLAQPPALIAPGDTVRFVPSESEPEALRPVATPYQPAHPLFEVVSSPGLTTIQDLGRPGLAHLGLAQGGVFDTHAAARANALVGNSPEAALLEMTWIGPTMAVLRNATIALEGADLECRVDGEPIPAGLSWFVRRGSTLRFTGADRRRGVRGYLAVAGGIDAPVVLGARSTSIQANFGGIQGRALQVGDVLGVAASPEDTGLQAGAFWPGDVPALPAPHAVLRFIPYRGRGEAPASARRAFVDQTFVLTEQSDRMGYRFRADGGGILPAGRGGLLSFGVVRGTIQLPPDGNPVVLNVDHQTTGGYPLLGVVIRADWPLVAQLAPRMTVRFVEVTLEEANAARMLAYLELSKCIRLLGAGKLPVDGC